MEVLMFNPDEKLLLAKFSFVSFTIHVTLKKTATSDNTARLIFYYNKLSY